jgi:starch synthase
VLTGILNGIDLHVWDPRTDPLLPARYSAEDLTGKARCKRALQERSGLPLSADLLIGMVQRVVEQKGLDLLVEALEPLMALPVQVVLLGTGDPVYERRMAEAGRRFPGRLAVHLMFDEPFAHLVEGGADAFLMPSRFEPCGLNQMYSMRYGTVPIVRRVGGLADTVVDVSPSSVANQTATGFVFEAYAAAAMLESIGRAVAAYGNRALWGQLMRTGLRQDFSWTRSAKAYEAVYARAQQEPVAHASGRRRWWWPSR